MTLEDVIYMIEEGEDIATENIVIEPPEIVIDSDGEVIEDDDIETDLIKQLNCLQLKSQVEINSYDDDDDIEVEEKRTKISS